MKGGHMLEFFRDGGWGMYPTVLFGFLMVAAGFLYLLRPESRYLPVVFCTGFLALGAGLLGTCTGLVTTFHYIQKVPVPEQVGIAAQGCAESLNNMILALILAFIAALATLGGVAREVRRPA
jgi:MotA/TolQ/ExbB proton channel family